MLCELFFFLDQQTWSHPEMLSKRSVKLPILCIEGKETCPEVSSFSIMVLLYFELGERLGFNPSDEECIHLYFAWTAILQNCVVYILRSFSWGLCKSGRVARKCELGASTYTFLPRAHWNPPAVFPCSSLCAISQVVMTGRGGEEKKES